MKLSSRLDQLHSLVRNNNRFGYFAVFCRIALAAGFLPSGMQKVIGERFTVLPVVHPMGHFLDAVYQTGYYYTFIGIMQVTAAVLLLIPRTALLGAFIYFPIILNIAVLSHAVRFEGSLVTSPLMVLACLYLICFDFHRWKFVLPFYRENAKELLLPPKPEKNFFPGKFFGGVAATVFFVLLFSGYGYQIKPYNTLRDCRTVCAGKSNPTACNDFCDCIHGEGGPLYKCLDRYEELLKTPVKSE